MKQKTGNEKKLLKKNKLAMHFLITLVKQDQKNN